MNGLRSLSTLHIALGISVAFHVALLALHFAAPEDFDRAFKDMPLEVVLVNARSDRTPERVQAIAQNNLEGGGEARDNQRVTTPLPPAEATATGDAMQDTERRIENLQEQQEQLLAQIRQQLSEVHEPDPHRDLGTPQARAEEQRRRQMLQLLGEIEKRINEENSRPKKRYLSPSTRQSDEALYYDHYRRIVEREGTRNFPTEHGRKLYGTLIMLVSLNAHGEVIATEVAQSSGIPAFLPDENVASIDPLLMDAIGGVRLQVRERDQQEALELLDQPEVEDLPSEDEPTCPRCDSPYWSRRWTSEQRLAIVGLLGLPLLWWKPSARWIRAVIAKIIREDAAHLQPDVTQWHEYRLMWSQQHIEYAIDGKTVFETATSPQGPLGLIIWVDNQFAAFPPNGNIRVGTEPNPTPAWMEITDLQIG